MTPEHARNFAITAHGNQVYNGQHPYIFHLDDIVNILKEFGHGEPPLHMAGYLHDTKEDTGTSIETLEAQFGPDVADTVERVSDEPGPDRKTRKLATYPKIKGHRAATIVKLADRIGNWRHSLNNPKHLYTYVTEYPDFRNHLFVPDIADTMWEELDKLYAQTLPLQPTQPLSA